MNIALCTDKKYAFACGVCVTSILENNKGEECNIYIITEGLDEESIKLFGVLTQKYNQCIYIIRIEEERLKTLKASDRFPRSIYLRYLLPELIKEEKVLYLDCDIIVTQNIKELYDTDISAFACGVIEDQNSDDIRLQNNLCLYKPYFNSGVLLMNLDWWRKKKTTDELIAFIYNNPDKCTFPDQDALNYILNDQILFLDFTYNYQDTFFNRPEDIFLHKSKISQLNKTQTNPPAIIHFTNPLKPWHKNCKHQLRNYFIYYKDISPWKDVKLKHYYPMHRRIANILIFIKDLIISKR